MKNLMALIGLLFLLSFSSNSPKAQVVVNVKPVRPVVHVSPNPRPRNGYTWIGGHWHYCNQQQRYVWRNGRWERNRPGYNWVAGSWVRHNNGYKWNPGRWRPVSVTVNVRPRRNKWRRHNVRICRR